MLPLARISGRLDFTRAGLGRILVTTHSCAAYDDGLFIAVTSENVAAGDVFVAFDAEDHEMLAVTGRVDGEVVYFTEVRSPALQVERGLTPSVEGNQTASSWDVPGPAFGAWQRTTFVGNRS